MIAGPSTTLTVVQGATLTRVIQGLNEDRSIPTQYLGTDVPTATVWLAQAEVSLLSPSVSWFSAAVCQVSLTLSGAQTSSLSLDTNYNLQIFINRAGTVYCIAWLYLQVLPAAGTQVASIPPDLISGTYAVQALQGLSLNPTSLELIPTLITASSQAVRRYCFDRYFDIRTIAEKYDVALDGTVRLYQVPVLIVQRVQAQPQLALTISNQSQSVQYAQAYFTFTGTPGGYASNAQTATGIYLNWASSGVLNNTTVPFTAGQTISSLATTIASIGSGWTASADQTLGLWPVTELDGGYVSQGCALGTEPDDGAQFSVLTDLANSRLDNPHRGFLWVGRQYGNFNADRWGPGGNDLFGQQQNDGLSQCKVTYQAGFANIPVDVQYWTAQLVKWKLEIGKQELLLMSEKGIDYQYQLAESMVAAMPQTVRQGLAQWRLHYA